ncbi:VF530 family protein [Shewanella xiamenensis]|uniref:VF530 family protein n=1 Tax=Shewanella xiamenensis TaxID=332186 RepID=UPI00313AEFFD
MTQENNPLHGIKLETIVTQLVEHYGWEELGARIKIRCFTEDPSIKSSLRFLRKTDWAREKVEYFYLKTNKLPLPAAKTSNAPAKTSAKKPAKPAQKPAQASTATSIAATDGQINSHIWGKRD